MHVCIQVVVEEDGVQYFICKKAFYQGFVLSRACDIVPAVCSTVRYNCIEFYQMNMITDDISQSFQLEFIALNEFWQKNSSGVFQYSRLRSRG